MRHTSNYKAWDISQDSFPSETNSQEQLEFLLNYAILSPSSHNTQPWKFSVHDNHISISPDFDQIPPVADRSHRQTYISLGCALATVIVAAEHFGFTTSFAILPEDKISPVTITISFTKTTPLAKYDYLFSSINKRRTNRYPHMGKKLTPSIVKALTQIIEDKNIYLHIITDRTQLQNLAELTSEAITFAFSNSLFKWELSKWIKSAYTSSPEGIPLFDVGIPYPLTIFGPWAIQHLPAWVQAKQDYALVMNSTSMIVLTTKDDSQRSWVKTGYWYQLLTLHAAKYDLYAGPMAGVIEHEPSRLKLQYQLKTKLIPCFFARLGYNRKQTRHSPRRPLDEVLQKNL